MGNAIVIRAAPDALGRRTSHPLHGPAGPESPGEQPAVVGVPSGRGRPRRAPGTCGGWRLRVDRGAVFVSHEEPVHAPRWMRGGGGGGGGGSQSSPRGTTSFVRVTNSGCPNRPAFSKSSTWEGQGLHGSPCPRRSGPEPEEAARWTPLGKELQAHAGRFCAGALALAVSARRSGHGIPRQERRRLTTRRDAVGSVRMVTDGGGAVVPRLQLSPRSVTSCGLALWPRGVTDERRQFAGHRAGAATTGLA
jgi:hypothetical protein